MLNSNLTSVNVVQKIDKGALEATKLAIFQNAADKAKAKSTSNYQNEAYTSSMRTEVMTQARETVQKPTLNFFNTGVQATGKSTVTTNENSYQTAKQPTSQNNTDKFKQPLFIREEQMSKDVNTAAIHESVMVQARNQMAVNTDFQTNLRFLNSRAAVELFKNRPMLT